MPTCGVRLLAVTLVAGALLAVPGAVPATFADPVDDQKQSVDQQIANLKEDLEGAADDLVRVAVALKGSQAQLAAARAAFAAAQAARAEAVARDHELAAQLEFAEAQLGQAQQDLAAEQLAAERSRQALGQIARDTYVGTGLSGLSVALQATTPEQFTDRIAIAGVALRAESGAIQRLSVQQAELRARSAKLDALRAQIAEIKHQSELVVVARSAAERDAADAQARIVTLVADQSAEAAAVQSKIDAEKQRLGELEAEQAKLQAILIARAKAAAEAARRRHGSGWLPPPSSGFLAFAAEGPITSGFGMRYHPILHIYRMHTGVDFGVPCGTPVRAAADGDIVSAGPAGGYGNRVVIDHGEVGGGDLATTYNHLSSILVRGGSVRRGQLIAYSGTTGLSTGCHLHFETLLDGRYVNPMNYL
ncbi:MAG TPA: peptidoglycan DD-metalloendopeptidase family protein [Kineosporiaceae bacterium]